jgi:hypothetical protein
MNENGTTFGRSPNALFRVVGDEVLIAIPRDAEFISLTSTGHAIWELLEPPIAFSELVSSLAELYGCGEDSIAPDVETFLNQLLERRAVVRHV